MIARRDPADRPPASPPTSSARGLTMLGMTIGVAAVIILVAVGNGSRQAVQSQHQRARVQRAAVFPARVRRGGGGGRRRGTQSRTSACTQNDVDALRTSPTRPTSRASTRSSTPPVSTLAYRGRSATSRASSSAPRPATSRPRTARSPPGGCSATPTSRRTAASSCSARRSSRTCSPAPTRSAQTVRVNGTGVPGRSACPRPRASNGAPGPGRRRAGADHGRAGHADRLRRR